MIRHLVAVFFVAGLGLAAIAEEKPQTVKVAGVQCSSELGDVAGNRE